MSIQETVWMKEGQLDNEPAGEERNGRQGSGENRHTIGHGNVVQGKSLFRLVEMPDWGDEPAQEKGEGKQCRGS